VKERLIKLDWIFSIKKYAGMPMKTEKEIQYRRAWYVNRQNETNLKTNQLMWHVWEAKIDVLDWILK